MKNVNTIPTPNNDPTVIIDVLRTQDRLAREGGATVTVCYIDGKPIEAVSLERDGGTFAINFTTQQGE